MMKTMQESLSDGDKKSESTVTIYEAWLDWGGKLHKFWERQSGLQEGKVGSICAISGMRRQ
jgi:hypothetical protein